MYMYEKDKIRHNFRSKSSYVPSFCFKSFDLDEKKEECETDHLLKGGKLGLEEASVGNPFTGQRCRGSHEFFA
uniref:Uncharacterized protein n=1 Tax=Anopheles arabiensis TaxID=7173 RepID=A0A182HVF8_ANOAR